MNLTALLNSLQSEIAHIPCKPNPENFLDAGTLLTYKEGHRDARPAACSLVAAFASKLEGELK